MSNFVQAFFDGGLGMYPILATGVVMVGASIRYAVDLEPIRLRFIRALAYVEGAMMLFWGVVGVVWMLSGMASESAPDRAAALAAGLSSIINTWGLGFLVYVLASIAVAVGVYRAGRRELAALRP